MSGTCAVEQCDQKFYARSVCCMHYNRLRKRGELGGAERERGVFGLGHVNPEGYRVYYDASHPLAGAQGKVLEHRSALFDAIGPGAHLCRWCGCDVVWRGTGRATLVADHLDDDRLNNDPSNLVPSCIPCNAARGRAS